MAINWNTPPDSLFHKLGKVVAFANSMEATVDETVAASPLKQLDDLEAILEPGDEKIGATTNQAKGRIASATAAEVRQIVDDLVRDILIQEVAIPEFLPQRTIQSILPEMIRLMVKDSITVRSRLYGQNILALAATAGNKFGGTMSGTDFRVGNYALGDPPAYSSVPYPDSPQFPNSAAAANTFFGNFTATNKWRFEQLGVATKDWTIRCVQDSSTGTPEGRELWEVRGQGPKGSDAGPFWHYRDLVTTLTGHTSASSILTNGGFENGLTGWTVQGGNPIVDSTGTQPFRGSNSLRFSSPGQTVISQTIPRSRFLPLTKYIVSYVYRQTIDLVPFTKGVSWTLTPGMDLDNNTLSIGSTAINLWQRRATFLNTKKNIPTNPIFSIGVFGLPQLQTTWINIDEIIIAPVPYVEGIYPVVLSGNESQKAVRGDSFKIVNTRTISKDDGRFQTFFVRWYGVALPDAGGTATGSDWVIDEAFAAPT